MREKNVSKIFEFSQSDVIRLKNLQECDLSDNVSLGSSDNLFCEVICPPRDMTDPNVIGSLYSCDANEYCTFYLVRFRGDSNE